jgi:thiol:disulfide interchange protein
MRSRVVALLVSSVAVVGWLTSATAAQEAATQAPPARQILGAALSQAHADGRNVFVHFSASWCGWCHKLEAFLKTDEGQLFQQYAIDVQLVVQESKGKELLENPGGAAMMKTWGGTGGIPFYVFLDDTGKVLSNANNLPGKTPDAPKGNIGYPANAQEVAAFDDMVTRGLPKMPAAVRAKIMAYIAGHP